MTTPGGHETLVETGEGHLIAMSAPNGWVHMLWYGSRYARLTAEEALTLAYALRSYARMVEPSIDPGRATPVMLPISPLKGSAESGGGHRLQPGRRGRVPSLTAGHPPPLTG